MAPIDLKQRARIGDRRSYRNPNVRELRTIARSELPPAILSLNQMDTESRLEIPCHHDWRTGLANGWEPRPMRLWPLGLCPERRLTP